MLDLALGFLVRELNAYLRVRAGATEVFGSAALTRFVNDDGALAIEAEHVGVTVINVEEERVMRSHHPESRLVNGRTVTLAPELKINLIILVAARFSQYSEALRHLSWVITFFQSRGVFTREAYPDLDPRIEKLIVEIQSLTLEQTNQVWAFVGGRQLPSAAYKVRMLALQDQEPAAVGTPITDITVKVGEP